MKTFESNGSRWGLVEVPIFATNLRLNMGYLIYDLTPTVSTVMLEDPGRLLRSMDRAVRIKNGGLKLPEGNYSLIGIASDLTEDQAAEIVSKSSTYFERIKEAYTNYLHPEYEHMGNPLFDAKDSLASLLTSLSLPPHTVVLKIIE